MFRKSSEELECPHVPKLPLLRCQDFLRIFLPFRSVGFCLRASGPGAAAPEARHRCTTQPRTATFQPWSGLSRPRQRWMRRLRTAVASDEGFGEENLLEAMGSLHEEVDEMLIRFKVLVDLCFPFLWKVSVKTCAPPFCCVL